MKLYTGVLICLITLFLGLVLTRHQVETLLLRAPGALFQSAGEDKISNLYTIKVINKSNRDLPIRLELETPSGEIRLMGGNMVVPKSQLSQSSVLVALPKGSLKGSNTPLRIGVYSGDKRLETVKTIFVGPRDDQDTH